MGQLIVHFEQFAKDRVDSQINNGKQENSTHVVGKIKNPPKTFGKTSFSEWPTADLAEFYRILGALQRSGFDVEFVHGKTDEGDLWALFEHTKTKQPVLNISLIDCIYNITNSVTDECIEGASLAEITNRIHTKMLGSQRFHAGNPFDEDRDTYKGAKSGTCKNSNVTMHPSACLIAFTATALLLIDLVVSSEAEAVETIASIDVSHLISLADDDNVLDFLLSGNVNSEDTPLLTKEDGQASGEDLQRELAEDAAQHRVTEINSSTRWQSQNLNKLQNLAHDIGGSVVLTSIIAMTAFVASHDNWMGTLSDKIENSKAAHLINDSSSGERAGVVTTHDLYNTDGEQSIYSNLIVEQKKLIHGEVIQDSFNSLISSVSNLIDLVSINTVTSMEKFAVEVQKTSSITMQLEKVEGIDAWLTINNSGVVGDQSTKLEIDSDETVISKDEFTPRPEVEKSKQLSDIQISKSLIDVGSVDIVSIDIPLINNSVKLDFLKIESDHFRSISVLTNNGLDVLAENDPEDSFNQLGFSDYNLHIAKGSSVENINFADIDQAEALVFYGGTILIDNFRPGIDAIFLASEKMRYESVEVIDQDLYLYIDDLNKIVLTDFFAFDTIA